jgi:hypothetical protein
MDTPTKVMRDCGGYKTTDIDKNYENDGSILDMYSEILREQTI